MTEIVFAAPIVPGKERLDRETLDEMADGRREEYEAALREAGISRQAVWHMQTPNGTLAIVRMEASDPEAAGRFANGGSEFARWFVERMSEVHGFDVSQPLPPVEKVHDVSV